MSRIPAVKFIDPQSGLDAACTAAEQMGAVLSALSTVFNKLSTAQQTMLAGELRKHFADIMPAAEAPTAAPAAPTGERFELLLSQPIDGGTVHQRECYASLDRLNARRREMGMSYIVEGRDLYAASSDET